MCGFAYNFSLDIYLAICSDPYSCDRVSYGFTAMRIFDT